MRDVLYVLSCLAEIGGLVVAAVGILGDRRAAAEIKAAAAELEANVNDPMHAVGNGPAMAGWLASLREPGHVRDVAHRLESNGRIAWAGIALFVLGSVLGLIANLST